MSLPETLDVQAALIYFHAYMYGPSTRGAFGCFASAGWVKENATLLLRIAAGEAAYERPVGELAQRPTLGE